MSRCYFSLVCLYNVSFKNLSFENLSALVLKPSFDTANSLVQNVPMNLPSLSLMMLDGMPHNFTMCLKNSWAVTSAEHNLGVGTNIAYFEKASKHMKKWADKKRRPLQFRVGDQVLIKLRPEQIRFCSRKDQRLVRKYEGPVEVLKKIGATSYRVALPTWMKIHPVIHVSNLKPYHPDPDDDQ